MTVNINSNGVQLSMNDEGSIVLNAKDLKLVMNDSALILNRKGVKRVINFDEGEAVRLTSEEDIVGDKYPQRIRREKHAMAITRRLTVSLLFVGFLFGWVANAIAHAWVQAQ